jgi:hypothetical protein
MSRPVLGSRVQARTVYGVFPKMSVEGLSTREVAPTPWTLAPSTRPPSATREKVGLAAAAVVVLSAVVVMVSERVVLSTLAVLSAVDVVAVMSSIVVVLDESDVAVVVSASVVVMTVSKVVWDKYSVEVPRIAEVDSTVGAVVVDNPSEVVEIPG